MLLAGWGECLRALLPSAKGIKVGVGGRKNDKPFTAFETK